MTIVEVPISDRHPRWPYINVSMDDLHAMQAQFGWDVDQLDRDNEIAQLKWALSFYANPKHHELHEHGACMASAVDIDGGDIARETLEKSL